MSGTRETAMRETATRAAHALWYGAHPARWLLWPLSLLFQALVAARRLAYRQGWLKSHDVGPPVIVVGNITAGGTGIRWLWIRGTPPEEPDPRF